MARGPDLNSTQIRTRGNIARPRSLERLSVPYFNRTSSGTVGACAGFTGPYIRDEEILDSIKTHVLKKVAGMADFGKSPGGCDASVTDGSAVQADGEQRIADGARGTGPL